MYIVYQSSDEFAIHTGISIYSLLINNKDLDNLTVIILSNGISDTEKEKIIGQINEFNRDCIWIDLNEKLKLISQEIDLTNFNGNLTASVEIFLSRILPLEIEEALLIDSDTVIVGSLEKIRPLKFSDYVIAAVPNYSGNIDYVNIDEDSKRVLDKNGFIYNTGVVYYNLRKWRNDKIDEKIKKSIDEIKERNYFITQTILNDAIPIDKVFKLNFKYNYFGYQFNKKSEKKIIKMYNENNLYFSDDPVIIHYKGFFSRPWYKELNDQWINYYRNIKSKTKWKDVPLDSIYKSNKFASLKFHRRLLLCLKLWWLNICKKVLNM